MNTLRLAKPGKNALTSNNPNDFLFDPRWNTPKIVKEASATPTLGTSGTEVLYNMAHGLNYTPFTLGFVKFTNSRVGLIGSKASNANFFNTALRVNATNVRFGYINNTGGNYTPTFKYLALEIPLAGTPSITDPGGRRIVITKTGYNALTETNPNNKIFDSQFGTIKYFSQGETTVVIPNGVTSYEVVLSTHNLGYYPMFSANFEYSADDPGRVFIMPLMFADAGFFRYDMVYTSTTQLVFRFEYDSAFYGPQTVKVRWKIYSKDLGL